MKEQTTMQLGMIGLGRMGANMVRRLLEKGQKCVVFDRSPKSSRRSGQRGSRGSQLIGRPRCKARATASYLADGAGGGS